MRHAVNARGAAGHVHAVDPHVRAVVTHARAADVVGDGHPPDVVAVGVEDVRLRRRHPGVGGVLAGDEEPAGERRGVADRHGRLLQPVRDRAGHDRVVVAAAFARGGGGRDAEVVQARRLHAEQQRPVARLRKIHRRRHPVRRRETEVDARRLYAGERRRPGHDADRRNLRAELGGDGERARDRTARPRRSGASRLAAAAAWADARATRSRRARRARGSGRTDRSGRRAGRAATAQQEKEQQRNRRAARAHLDDKRAHRTVAPEVGRSQIRRRRGYFRYAASGMF